MGKPMKHGIQARCSLVNQAKSRCPRHYETRSEEVIGTPTSESLDNVTMTAFASTHRLIECCHCEADRFELENDVASQREKCLREDASLQIDRVGR